MTTNDDRMAPLRRFLTDLVWDEAAASVRLDGETQAYDETTDETTDDICRELRAVGLDPERMQRRVRELRDAARREVTR